LALINANLIVRLSFNGNFVLPAMPNVVTVIKNTWSFLNESIWQIRVDKVNKKQGFFIKQFRILSLAIRGFNEDNCLTKATALTYYTLFSIVPVLALIFAISKGFGFDTLQTQLLIKYSEYADVLKKVFTYADQMLASTKGGVIAGFGVVLLLWSVMKLLLGIENNFNEIWEIKRGRTWLRKVTDYMAIMIVGPIFLIVSGGLTVAIQTKMGNFEFLSGASTIFLKLISWALVASVFALLYIILPNTKVKAKSAFSAGITAMVLFELLGWAYIKFQIGANSLSAIYGGFAALPLFLIWMQYSWYIVLFGAELAFANQFVDHYELENEINKLSSRYKKAIALLIANLVAKDFYNQKTNLSAQQICEKLDLPLRLVRNILNEFVETGIFIELKGDKEKESTYQPGLTESKLTVRNILNTLESKGVNALPILYSDELKSVDALMLKLDTAWDNAEGNKLVKDIA